jgi:hypothetical protein
LAGASPSDGAQVAAVKAAAWRVAGNYFKLELQV